MRYLIALFVCFGQAILLSADDWPQFRGAQSDGVCREEGWVAGLDKVKIKKVWGANVSTGFSSLSISRGLALVTGHKYDSVHIYAFDAMNGKLKWENSYKEKLEPKYYKGGPNSTPTIDEDRVYLMGREGKLFCYNLVNGKKLWQKNLKSIFRLKKPTWGFSGSPTVYKNMLLINVGEYGLALNKKDGEKIWYSGRGASGYATPVQFKYDSKDLFAFFSGKRINIIDVESGKSLWSNKWRTSYQVNAANPLIFNNKMFISSAYNYGCALFDLSNPKSIKELWRNRHMRNHFNASIHYKGYLYGFDGRAGSADAFNCLDVKTGALMWSVKGLGIGSLLLAGDRLIILSEQGELVIAKANGKKFDEMWRKRILNGLCWSSPSIANGLLYARDAAGYVVCYDLRG